LKSIPFIQDNTIFSDFDLRTMKDCVEFQQDFFIHGEKSKILKSIQPNKIKSILTNYGTEFSSVLNALYEEGNGRKFRLSDVVELNNSLIATVFKFDSENQEPNFYKNLSELNIEKLTDNIVSEQLSIKRIIKLYPQKDTIVFIKPNQYRYWISLTAYRDADKCFSDFSNAGF
jgi:hypothetical protein